MENHAPSYIRRRRCCALLIRAYIQETDAIGAKRTSLAWIFGGDTYTSCMRLCDDVSCRGLGRIADCRQASLYVSYGGEKDEGVGADTQMPSHKGKLIKVARRRDLIKNVQLSANSLH